MPRLAVLFTLLALFSACAGDPAPSLAAGAAPPAAADPEAIHLVGSGAMAPLAAALAEGYQRKAPSPRLVIEESVGSTGGIAATFDGAVDVGLVARPLTDAERRLDLVFVPIGFDAVVLAGHPGLNATSVTSDELRALYSGEKRTFADGSRANVLLRDRGESANAVLEALVPGLVASRDAAPKRAHLRVLYHDASMTQALAATPGSFGVASLGVLTAARMPLKLLALDGHQASVQSLLDGTWPAVRPLAFVVRGERLARVQGFLDFVSSSEGAALVRAAGYRPEAVR
jgi:phosphate transport system substrate-binding protein